jgi:hypothetical protein
LSAKYNKKNKNYGIVSEDLKTKQTTKARLKPSKKSKNLTQKNCGFVLI